MANHQSLGSRSAAAAKVRAFGYGCATGRTGLSGHHGSGTHCRRGGSELGGEVSGQSEVVLADAPGHEETFDDADDGGNACPAEDDVEDAKAGTAQVEVVSSERSQE